LTSEPEALLPFLTLGSGLVLWIVGPAIAEVVRRRAPALPPDELAFLGDAIGRVVVSYAISPNPDIDSTAAPLAGMVCAYAHRAAGGAPQDRT